MTNLLLLSLTFSPDNVSTAQIMAALAARLQSSGTFNVRVLTTTPHYHPDAGMAARQPLRWKLWPILRRSEVDGVEVTHVVMLSKSCPKPLRLLSWFWFVAVACVAGLTMRFKMDAILVCTPPPFIGPCAAIIAALRGARLVYNVQELYPDIAVNLGAMRAGGAIERFFAAMERFTYRRAKYITSITEAMCAKLRERLDPAKVRLVPNFVQCSGAPASARFAASGRRFTVTYAGNMGVPQNLALLVEAARLAPEIDVWFIGDGRDKPRLRQLAAGLGNVTFTDYLPISEMPRIYADSDLFYVGQDPAACADGIPSKLYRILGAGRPIVAATAETSDMAAFVRASGGGVVVGDFSAATLAAKMRELAADPAGVAALSAQGRRHVLARYSLESVAAAYAELLG